MINNTFSRILSSDGWCFIEGKNYAMKKRDLSSLRKSFSSQLTLDPYSNGNRYRAYVQCKFENENDLSFGHFHDYQQTKAFNPDTGGIIRSYPMIQNDVLRNSVFLSLVSNDIDFVKKYQIIGHPSDLSIGIHLIRYKATFGSPSYSSPLWLHRDDEDVVFVHLVNRSHNLVGGENIIAQDSKTIETVFRLDKSLDTLVVNHKKLHAVTPVAHLESKGSSFRDIILVTFQIMKNAVGGESGHTK